MKGWPGIAIALYAVVVLLAAGRAALRTTLSDTANNIVARLQDPTLSEPAEEEDEEPSAGFAIGFEGPDGTLVRAGFYVHAVDPLGQEIPNTRFSGVWLPAAVRSGATVRLVAVLEDGTEEERERFEVLAGGSP